MSEVAARVQVVMADYRDSRQGEDILALMDEYARDPFGGGEPMSDFCREHLLERLAEFPGAFSVLAYDGDGDGDRALGLVNCFMGFSTFTCRPLVNIHDVVVSAAARGAGVCTAMLDFVAREAKNRGCCKLTLEVLEKNLPAQTAYRRSGFKPYALDEEWGTAQFWQRYL
ncbi:GNAT family N-acetyltransferase [Microbulbifer sp.]|uniref:GNAT family N-acetyltransferase n=1 Tax=Microbulbifer sp. TaxID=1908541 RepID=UPI003F3172D0